MGLVRFYSAIIKLALVLAMLGLLKSCTLQLLGLAAEKTQKGIMPYSAYTQLLTK